MYIFRSIHEIINTVAASRTLLTEMFEKRKTLSFRYSDALALLKDDENRLKLLLEKEVIRQNGNFVELDARFMDFFELLLEANEEINTAVIDENIEYLHELMDYYAKERIPSRKESYVRNIKITFRKIARTTIRNIMNLQTSIDHAFKHEPTYQIKIAKLENLDKKRINIQRLIDTTENLILHDERKFFQEATDEELKRILLELRSELQLSAHSLIRAQQDIINYLNQIKSQVILVEKIRKVKYLHDTFELRAKSNLTEVVEREHSVLLEGNPPSSFKLSLGYLSGDEARPVILKEKIWRPPPSIRKPSISMKRQAVISRRKHRLYGIIRRKIPKICSLSSCVILFRVKWTTGNARRCSARSFRSTKTSCALPTGTACTKNTNMPKYIRHNLYIDLFKQHQWN